MTDRDQDFETQNTINHYRNKLHDIHEWHQQLNDTIGTISGYSMDLSGVTSPATPRLPGGDALAMLAPYSDGHLEPDDLPHPTQILTNHAHTIDHLQQHTPTTYTLTTALRRNHDAIPWLHANGHLPKWATEINQLWTRLGKITGNLQPNPQPQPPTRQQLWEALEQNPHTLLPRQALTTLGYNKSTITTWKQRGILTPNNQGQYLAADLLNMKPTNTPQPTQENN